MPVQYVDNPVRHDEAGHPHYSNAPERPMKLRDRVTKGARSGVICGMTAGTSTRIRVQWGTAGFTDEHPRALLFSAEPETIDTTLTVSVETHHRIMTGNRTDADLIALEDAYLSGVRTEDPAEPPLFATGNGWPR